LLTDFRAAIKSQCSGVQPVRDDGW